jgi:hypothetical protein
MDTARRDRPTGIRAAATPDAGDADATPTVDITDLDDEPWLTMSLGSSPRRRPEDWHIPCCRGTFDIWEARDHAGEGFTPKKAVDDSKPKPAEVDAQ